MTTAQRARLVVAMGLLNLILATVALTAGVVGPSPRPSDVAGVSGTSPPTIAPGAVTPSASPSNPQTGSPGPTVGPTVGPTPSQTEPSPTLPAEPSATPGASEPPIVAVIPTPGPGTPGPSPIRATPQPTVPPTPAPTARPTLTPQPVTSRVRHPRPPCPGDSSGPPGHNKTEPPPGRPCSSGPGAGHAGGSSGIVVVLPLAIGGLAASIRSRTAGVRRRIARRGRVRTASNAG